MFTSATAVLGTASRCATMHSRVQSASVHWALWSSGAGRRAHSASPWMAANIWLESYLLNVTQCHKQFTLLIIQKLTWGFGVLIGQEEWRLRACRLQPESPKMCMPAAAWSSAQSFASQALSRASARCRTTTTTSTSRSSTSASAARALTAPDISPRLRS